MWRSCIWQHTSSSAMSLTVHQQSTRDSLIKSGCVFIFMAKIMLYSVSCNYCVLIQKHVSGRNSLFAQMLFEAMVPDMIANKAGIYIYQPCNM